MKCKKMTQSNNSQTLLKLLVVSQTLALLVYTGFAIRNEGWTLFNIFIANINSFNWNGQFNLDFSCYLTLSGLWIMWRNNFSFPAIIFAAIAMIVGIIVFAPYILYLSVKESGDWKKLLIGNR